MDQSRPAKNPINQWICKLSFDCSVHEFSGSYEKYNQKQCLKYLALSVQKYLVYYLRRKRWQADIQMKEAGKITFLFVCWGIFA